MRPCPRKSLVLLIWLALGAPSGSSRAEDMYRWLDAAGRIHFGSAPPPGALNLERIEPSRDAVTVVPDGPPAAKGGSVEATRQRQAGAAERLRELEAQEPTQIDGRSESEWRAAMVAAEQSVSSAKTRLEQAEYDLSNAYSLGRSAYYQRRVDRYRKQLEEAEEALGRLEDEARGPGVPPGWLR